MKNRNLNTLTLINTLSVYVVILLSLINMILNFNELNVLLAIFVAIRYSILANLHSNFWIKRDYFISKNPNFSNRFTQYVINQEIEVNFTNFIQLHKWKEKHFVEDQITLYDINKFYFENEIKNI
jgi:hypothetical protein